MKATKQISIEKIETASILIGGTAMCIVMAGIVAVLLILMNQ